MASKNNGMIDLIKAQMMMNSRGNPVKNFLLMSLYDYVSQFAPIVIDKIKDKYFKKLPSIKDLERKLNTDDDGKKIQSVIFLEKVVLGK